MAKKPTPKRRRKAPYRGPRMAKDKHLAVVDAYFANGLDRRAALLAAGYSEKTATTNLQSVFDHPWVKAEIERRQDDMRAKSVISAEIVVNELAKIAMARLGDLLVINDDGTATMDFRKLTDDQKAVMSEFIVDEYVEGRGPMAAAKSKTKVKFADKKGALELLGRYFGIFNDKLELSAPDLVERLQKGRERARMKTIEGTVAE